MKVAFFSKDPKDQPQIQDIVLNNQSQTLIETSLTSAPEAILLNFEDEAFIKVKLDD